MEGRKAKLIRSLRFRLCVILAIVGILCTASNSFRSYHRSVAGVNAFVDEELSSIASVIVNYDVILPKSWDPSGAFRRRHHSFDDLLNHMFGPRSGFLDRPFLPVPSLNDLYDKHQDIIIAPLYPKEGEVFYFEAGSQDGFYNVRTKDKMVRAFVATNRAGIRFVVARPSELIDLMIRRLMMISIVDFIVLTLIFLPCVIIAVHILFIPVRKLARELDERKGSDLTPIAAGALPSEMDVFTDSINTLFRRTSDAINRERRFIADAAHEMRTPLTAISLQAQSLDESKLPASEAEKVADLKTAIARQRTLTNDLLNYARLQCGAYKKNISEFYIKDLFIEILEDLGSVADDREIDLGLKDNCDGIIVKTDRNALKTVVSNLVSNALKYTKKGGICDISALKENDRVVIRVEDTGPGIKEDELDSVFNAFYRVGGDTSNIEGTGLGLSIVKSTCDAIDAQIVLSNRSEGGLRAQITI